MYAGNLARATYTDSSDYQWPWSYSQCDRSEHPDFQLQQEVSACNVINHYGLHSHQGRGAPEIDILEVSSARFSYDAIYCVLYLREVVC
jgi:beta-glucan synthesis-associated protein KRE6